MPTPRGISGPHSHFSRGIRISNRDRLGSTGLDWDLDSAGVGLGSDSRETPHLPAPPDLPDLSDWDLTPRGGAGLVRGKPSLGVPGGGPPP